jgi:hypothetical protein
MLLINSPKTIKVYIDFKSLIDFVLVGFEIEYEVKLKIFIALPIPNSEVIYF